MLTILLFIVGADKAMLLNLLAISAPKILVTDSTIDGMTQVPMQLYDFYQSK
jgi:hypothetical protein